MVLIFMVFQTDFTTYNSINQQVDQDENTTEFSSYFNYQFKSIRWIIEPGLRLQYYGKLGTSLEPRIGIKYITSDKFKNKISCRKLLSKYPKYFIR